MDIQKKSIDVYKRQYEYLINIIPDYSGMPGSETEPAEMPKGAGASLIRTLKEGDRKKSWQYDFSTNTWHKKTCMEYTGFTEKQFDIVQGCGYPYSPDVYKRQHTTVTFPSISTTMKQMQKQTIQTQQLLIGM